MHGFGAYVAEALEGSHDALGGRRVVVWENDDQFIAGLPDAKVILGVRFPDCDWSAAKHLRLIQLAGSGVDGLAPTQPLPANIEVANSHGLSAPAMAEYALAQVLALAKRFPEAWENQAARKWRHTRPIRLADAQAVVVGAGPVGQLTAAHLRAIGMTVTGVRRSGRTSTSFDQTFGVEQLDEALAAADVIVIAVPLTKETRNLVTGDRLAKLKPGALLVNVSRGGVIDQSAVGEALRSGRLGGAALDVFEVEPLPTDDPLWDSPRSLLTPHMSWYSEDYRRSVLDMFVINIARIECGESPLNRVDVTRGY
ncbi:hypothetical protein GCM10022234_22740 [Aeromicrobium panaciterrae]